MIMIEDEPFSSTFDEFIDYEEPAEPAKTPTRQTAEMTLGNEETPTTTPVKTPGKPKVSDRFLVVGGRANSSLRARPRRPRYPPSKSSPISTRISSQCAMYVTKPWILIFIN